MKLFVCGKSTNKLTSNFICLAYSYILEGDTSLYDWFKEEKYRYLDHTSRHEKELRHSKDTNFGKILVTLCVFFFCLFFVSYSYLVINTLMEENLVET